MCETLGKYGNITWSQLQASDDAVQNSAVKLGSRALAEITVSKGATDTGNELKVTMRLIFIHGE